jgi:hypothetical protein
MASNIEAFLYQIQLHFLKVLKFIQFSIVHAPTHVTVTSQGIPVTISLISPTQRRLIHVRVSALNIEYVRSIWSLFLTLLISAGTYSRPTH